MKKILLLILLLATELNISAQYYRSYGSYEDPFEDKPVNERYSIGFLGGALGTFDEICVGAIGMNITIKGFYADVLGWPATHSEDVRIDKWDDSQSFACHFGYQIPLSKAFRIIPIVGYTSQSNGVTDGSDWHVSGYHIYNKYTAKEKFSDFDYGATAVINTKHVNIYLTGTRHSLYGGIGCEF